MKTKTNTLLLLAVGGVAGYWLMSRYLAKPSTKIDPATGLSTPPTDPLNIPQLSGYYRSR